MKTLNTGVSKYKNSDGQWAYIPCLTGMQGEKGEKGNPGEGIPTGGTPGQVLAKNTNNDYDTHWINLPTTGGGSSVTIDDTLTKSGVAADAKATGDQIKKVKETIPTTLPNPNALTFSGLVEGNYDGSEAVNIEVPQDMWIHVTIDSSYSHISERDTAFEEIDNYYTSHPNNNIFMSCLINNIECIGTLESASPGNSYTFGVMSCPTADATVNGITKKSITIYENDGYGIDDNILSIPYVRVSGDITFERAVCELLAKANIGYVIYPGSYDGGDYYLVIKTNFDRGRGGCLVYDRYGTFKSYRYTLINGEEWTITPTSSPNIISITTKNGKYYSSHNFNEIKKINPENMLVCYNDVYGRLVSMDDNKAVFKIPNSINNPAMQICINSDDSVEIIRDLYLALLSKNDDDTYALDLSDISMGDEFSIMYYDDVTQSSYLGKMYKDTNDGTIFRIWLSETEIMDVTVNLNEINDDTDLSAVPVTVEKKSIVPAALPNPNKLTLKGLGQTKYEYDGSSALTVQLPPLPYVETITEKNGKFVSETTDLYGILRSIISLGSPYVYIKYNGEVMPLYQISDSSLKFIGLNKSFVIDSNSSITQENVIYNDALYVTVIKQNNTYTVQEATNDDFIDKFSCNFVLIAMQDKDSHTIQFFQGNLTNFDEPSGIIEYTCINYNIIIKFTFKIDEENIPTVTVEQKPIVPTALPNPNKLTFEGAVTAEYDGSGAVTINIPEESSTVRVEKTASDTTTEIEPNKLYVFPEMASLTYTLATPSDTSIANEYHFVFRSGATATELVHPANVSVPDNFTVDKNKVYEISILEGCLAYQSWAVS